MKHPRIFEAISPEKLTEKNDQQLVLQISGFGELREVLAKISPAKSVVRQLLELDGFLRGECATLAVEVAGRKIVSLGDNQDFGQKVLDKLNALRGSEQQLSSAFAANNLA